MGRLGDVLRLGRAFTPMELLIALGALALVTIAALAPHIRHGGFYLDDWANAATSLQPPGPADFGNALSAFADLTIYRPVLVVYVPLTYFLFGTHMHYHLALAALLALFSAAMFYGVLRTLGLPWIHALLIGALAIVFPWSDSTRLWITADQASLSIFFMFAGMLLALIGLERTWRWHLWAAGLYLLSILTYEVTLPVIVCAGGLYCLRAGWRRARSRWLLDVVVVVAGGAWVGSHTPRSASGIDQDLDHLRQIVSAGGGLVGRAGIAVGPVETGLVLAVIAGALALGLGAYLLAPGRVHRDGGWGLPDWLILTAGGLLFAALGWAMFIPADPYYTPTIFGEVNRVNALSAFGLILAVYGTCGIFGTLISQAYPRRSLGVASGVTLALGTILFVSYVHVLRRHIEIWNLAFSAETRAISKTKERLPNLPPGTTLFVSDYPANQSPNVPILDSTWGVDGMIKMEYDDSSISAAPVLPGFSLSCGRDGVVLERDGAVELVGNYRAVRLLNLTTGERAAPANRRNCRRVVGRYTAGPLFLSPNY